MGRKKGIFGWTWRILLGIVLSPLALILLLALLLCLPPVQRKAVSVATGIISDKTGVDISLQHIGIKLPLDLSLDGLLAMNQQADTLLNVDCLRLSVNFESLKQGVIGINALRLSGVSIDTQNLIESVGINGSFGELCLVSDSTLFSGGSISTTFNKISLKDADVGIVLFDTADSVSDSTSAATPDWKMDVRNLSLENITFSLLPAELYASVDKMAAAAHISLADGVYSVSGLTLTGGVLTTDGKNVQIASLNADATVDSSSVSVPALHLEASEPWLGQDAVIDASALLTLDDLTATVKGDVLLRDGAVSIDGKYGIPGESYDARVTVHSLRLDKIVSLAEVCSIDGRFSASGSGFDPLSRTMQARLDASLSDCRYGTARVRNTLLSAGLANSVISGTVSTDAAYSDTSLTASASGKIKFRLADWNTPKPAVSVDAALRDISLLSDSIQTELDNLSLAASTDRKATGVSLQIPGINLTAAADGHLLSLPPAFSRLGDALKRQTDSLDYDINELRRYFPVLSADVTVDGDNPFKSYLQAMGMDFGKLTVKSDISPGNGLSADIALDSFRKDTFTVDMTTVRIQQNETRLNLTGDVTFKEQHRLPAFTAQLDANIGVHESDAALSVRSDIDNGILTLPDVSGNLALDLSAALDGDLLSASGKLDIDNLLYQNLDFGDRTLLLGLEPADSAGAYRAFADISDFPMDILTTLVGIPEIAFNGAADASVTLHGKPDSYTLTAEVLPKNLSMTYKPFAVRLTLGQVPIRLNDMTAYLTDLPVYAADSSYVMLNGSVNLNDMTMDVTAEGSSFRPIPLERNDSVPFFGNLQADITASVTGPLDSLMIHSDIGILPSTDITYLIDSRNDVNVKAGGNLALDITPDGGLGMTGRVDITDGTVRYSLPYYPLRPFTVQEGSYVEFNGDVTSPILNITATQPAKATVSTNGSAPRQVDFTVGLKVTDGIDNLGLDFIIDAPYDNDIHEELESFSKEDRSVVAAAMLATGMYVSQYNDASKNSGYALSSILQSRLNALTTNRLRDSNIDLDLGIGESRRGDVTATDYSVKLSKSFFDDRLKFTLGGRVSDNKTVNKSATLGSVIDDVSVKWQARKGGDTYLNVFHKNDYDNIIDGELQKDGIGVTIDKHWNVDSGRRNGYLDAMLEGNISHRSNRQIGPDLTITTARSNLLKLGETVSTKLTGAYYWNYRNNATHGRRNTDSYHIGADITMSFPRFVLPWKFDIDKIDGTSTHFGIGFMHENIAGGYSLNKVTADITYQLRTSPYVTHSFVPFSLSLIRTYGMNDTEEYIKEVMKDKSMVSSMVKDEYVPSIQYRIMYDNYADEARPTGTRFEGTVSESGNIISGLQALAGRSPDLRGKSFIFPEYSQFVRLTAELRNLFRLTEKTSIATRVYAGSVFSYGNSITAPLSERFYSGGNTSIRAFDTRSLGPANYHCTGSYDPYYLHSGETKFELNGEYRFPIIKQFEGAVFIDAGNTWTNVSLYDGMTEEQILLLKELLAEWNINPEFDGRLKLENLLRETAVGTGFGVRFVFQSLVIRLDLGIALHAPYDTGRSGFYNIGDFWKEGMQLNFAIGYPF